jgi:hypothetical protein
MKRLLPCRFWLYIELLQGCNRWPNVWRAAGQDLARQNSLAYRETSNSSTLKLTRKLHRATSNVITLRENLRLHIFDWESPDLGPPSRPSRYMNSILYLPAEPL